MSYTLNHSHIIEILEYALKVHRIRKLEFVWVDLFDKGVAGVLC